MTKARATKLITDAQGAVVGVEYEKDGKKFTVCNLHVYIA